MKNENYQIVGRVPKSNRKIEERDKFDSLNTYIYDCSFSWLGTGTANKKGLKQCYAPKLPLLSEMMHSCKSKSLCTEETVNFNIFQWTAIFFIHLIC